ncbi:D(2)-like dopamine receptor [Paramacrobiotus metropolitanus]|uniref:D(2)-like dopamine receptor n=1 Tax=Paramacrobiotus metropolitanus TaxID=2943436 RepID=UPI0024457B10|nr:D(2)-like dopamine receptor [Paramacrobiotus metropolitanus]
MELTTGVSIFNRTTVQPGSSFALEGKRAYELLRVMSQLQQTGAERAAAAAAAERQSQSMQNNFQLLLNPATGYSYAASSGVWNGAPNGGPGDLHSLTYRILATLLHLAIFILGVTGNVLLVIAVRRTRSLHTSTYCYLVSLATADLLVLFSAVPDQIVAHHIGNKWISGQAGCSLMVFANFLGINAGSLSILAFTVDRYIAACRPLLVLRVCKWQFARKVSLALWIVAFVYCSPWLGLTQIKPYPRQPGQVICDFRLSHNQYTALFISDLLIFYVIPLLFAGGVYLKLGIILHNSLKDFRVQSPQSDNSPASDLTDHYDRPHISAPAALAHSRGNTPHHPPPEHGDDASSEALRSPQHRLSADPAFLLIKPRDSSDSSSTNRPVQRELKEPLLQQPVPAGEGSSVVGALDVMTPMEGGPSAPPIHRLSADPIFLRQKPNEPSVQSKGNCQEAVSFPGTQKSLKRASFKKVRAASAKDDAPTPTAEQTTARLMAMRRDLTESSMAAVWIREAPKNRLQKLVRSRTRVYRMLVVIVVLFAVTWLPYRGVLVYNCFAAAPWLNAYYLLFAKTCVYINCAINPYLYNIMSRRFRFALYQVLTCTQPYKVKSVNAQYSR